jgi:2,3-bisphosphoglycerate-independent phosphoglycerate mutase
MIVANFAAPDMVAHTGDFNATVKACEIVDQCIGEIVSRADAMGGVALITADHGNAEEVLNVETKEIDTEHSSFPVPFVLISKHFLGQHSDLPKGILADVAPTMLKLLGLSKPASMTGRSLI